MDPFEIQVYQGEHNDPGQASLELHANETLRGRQDAAYPGETPPDRVLRLTLEPALGLTEWLELGAYLQSMVSPSNGAAFAGWKLRCKLVVPERVTLPLRLGINVELAHVPSSVEQEGWGSELRPIVAVAWARWALAFNPIIAFALNGPDAGKPAFEPAGKLRWNSNLGFALGFEHYAALGRFDQGLLGVHDQAQVTFAALDLEAPDGQPEGMWELNLGVGRSWTLATPQRWIAKAILGRTF